MLDDLSTLELGGGLVETTTVGRFKLTIPSGLDRYASQIFLWPAVLSILVLSIFPYIASLVTPVTRKSTIVRSLCGFAPVFS